MLIILITFMESNTNANARRVIAAITELALCRGSLAAASRCLGRRRNYFSRVRERGAMEWGSFFTALETFEVDHLRFTRWAHCADREPALEAFGAGALSCAVRREPSFVSASRLAYLQGRLNRAPLGSLQTALVDELHELRNQDPAEAASCAERALENAPSALLTARLLGVWASAARLDRRLNDAKVALWTALRIAATEESCADTLGDLIQRAAYVEGDLGDFEQALALADTACAHYERSGRPQLFGRALVDRGLILHRGNQGVGVTSTLEHALLLLAPDDHKNRCAAFHLLGDMAIRRGQFDRARTYLEAAIAEAPTGRATVGQLHWVQARLDAAEGKWESASRRYGQAADAFGVAIPVGAAFVAAEHARLLVEHGEFDRARRLADGMRWAVIPLEDENPLAASALTELIVASDHAAFESRAIALTSRIERAIVGAVGEFVARPRV